jgi:integrase
MAKVVKRQTNDGHRWVLDFFDQEGKRQRITMRKGKTRADAERELAAKLDEVDNATFVSKKAVPLFSKVAKDWLVVKKANLRESTYTTYEGHTKNHFPEFESRRIRGISVADVEKYISKRQYQGMPIATLRKILVSLNQIFNYAVRHKYIVVNPLSIAERPREKQDPAKIKTTAEKMQILNPDQIKDLLAAVENQKYKLLFQLAAFSGCRQGELLGLKWKDIDWTASQISIQRTFNHQQFFSVKTKSSIRRVDVGPATMQALKLWKVACPPNDLDLVFPNEAGKPINHNNMVNRYFNPALKKAKIQRVKFHALRHSYASIQLAQGRNIKYIQNQLGHSSPTVTLNIYSHLLKDQNQKAAMALEEKIFGDSEKLKTN